MRDHLGGPATLIAEGLNVGAPLVLGQRYDGMTNDVVRGVNRCAEVRHDHLQLAVKSQQLPHRDTTTRQLTDFGAPGVGFVEDARNVWRVQMHRLQGSELAAALLRFTLRPHEVLVQGPPVAARQDQRGRDAAQDVQDLHRGARHQIALADVATAVQNGLHRQGKQTATGQAVHGHPRQLPSHHRARTFQLLRGPPCARVCRSKLFGDH
mmetsp:Transcript_7365/g.16684  ORF Transcript_7365/g.16684 Transcript_7365/m.16684 type:complete len:209 (-) Transcript_7365:1553-2179(-)